MYIELDIVNIRCYIHLKGVLYGQMMNLDIYTLLKKVLIVKLTNLRYVSRNILK